MRRLHCFWLRELKREKLRSGKYCAFNLKVPVFTENLRRSSSLQLKTSLRSTKNGLLSALSRVFAMAAQWQNRCSTISLAPGSLQFLHMSLVIRLISTECAPTKQWQPLAVYSADVTGVLILFGIVGIGNMGFQVGFNRLGGGMCSVISWSKLAPRN